MRVLNPDDTTVRLLVALGELWEGFHRAGIDPARRGVQLSHEYLGGYLRVSAGPGAHARIVLEWHEGTGRIRILRNEEWPGIEAAVCSTVKQLREEARARGILDVVDKAFVRACTPGSATVVRPAPPRETALAAAKRA